VARGGNFVIHGFVQRGPKVERYPWREVVGVVSVVEPARNRRINRGQRPSPCLVTFKLRCGHEIVLHGPRYSEVAAEDAELVKDLRCLACGPDAR